LPQAKASGYKQGYPAACGGEDSFQNRKSMCGITGFTSRISGTASENILKKMTQSLSHRGPDDQGFYSSNGIFFGHTRLSIIDIERGHQPMMNEDSAIAVIFNGEIYNFLELKETLKDHKFRTSSDTEVIVHLYEKHGKNLFNLLNGMFAMAIWDDHMHTLIVARDRMGKKPLYYSVPGRDIIFASELKTILLHPDVERRISPFGAAKYLALDYVPAPMTIIENVYKLEPGHMLEWHDGHISITQYWDIDPLRGMADSNDSISPSYENEDAAKERLSELLMDSVRNRLISDVPLGLFLSGGIDSTTIAVMMHEFLPSRSIKTFTIGFDEKSFDESSHARTIARHFQTDHHEEILSSKVMLESMNEILEKMDEPVGDNSFIPTFLLSKFARKHVTVALGGDGGDELFLGYPTFQAHKIARILDRVLFAGKKEFVSVMKFFASLIPVNTGNISLDFQIKRFIEGMDFDSISRHFIWIGGIRPEKSINLLSSDLRKKVCAESILSDIFRHAEKIKCKARDDFDVLSYVYAKLYLQDDILVKVDRASMANSLEVRAPFLDYRIVDFAASLPASMKLKFFSTKFLLKKMLKGRVPDSILRRPKKGFGIPVSGWFRKELRAFLIDTLDPMKIREQGIFDEKQVLRLIDDHMKGRADNRKPLWSLLVFQIFMERLKK
jgi:asparagine synthase (glutamine-hydrolysing)